MLVCPRTFLVFNSDGFDNLTMERLNTMHMLSYISVLKGFFSLLPRFSFIIFEIQPQSNCIGRGEPWKHFILICLLNFRVAFFPHLVFKEITFVIVFSLALGYLTTQTQGHLISL